MTKRLIDAGFMITASWPINTEAEGSLHIKDKSAANSTIFLVCRPRPAQKPEDGVQYWEDLEPRVKAAVRKRIEQFQAGGIRGVDLYLSCFGPALEELLEQNDPYAVSPEDALDAAKQLLDDNVLANSPIFLTALEAVLEVLPLSARYTGFDPVKAAAPAASDFEALENLRRLALAEQVPAPKQLELLLAELAEAS